MSGIPIYFAGEISWGNTQAKTPRLFLLPNFATMCIFLSYHVQKLGNIRKIAQNSILDWHGNCLFYVSLLRYAGAIISKRCNLQAFVACVSSVEIPETLEPIRNVVSGSFFLPIRKKPTISSNFFIFFPIMHPFCLKIVSLTTSP